MAFENKLNDPQQVQNKNFVSELKNKISSLEVLAEGKDAELNLLQSELHNTLSPAEASMQINQLVLGMLIELTEFIAKKGKSKKTDESRVRLVKIMELVSKLDNLSSANYSLQCNNRFIVGVITRLRLENQELRKQIFNMQQAENFNGREVVGGQA